MSIIKPFKNSQYILIAGLLLAQPLQAKMVDIYAGDSFAVAAESLVPGDTLIVHAGTYIDSGKLTLSVKGTSNQPVVIQGAENEVRPHISRNAGDQPQNTINIEGATYLTIRGIEISSNGGDGVNLSGNPSYITLDDLLIHDIDVGVNFRSDMSNIIVRKTHIYNTGTDGGTGEGMYVGCNYASCVVSNSIIENNLIHDTRNATQGDGIEVKRGSYGNIIRDNVIYNTKYPCLLLYGTDGNPRNIVERNVMWNCGDSGIQVAADAKVRNNIIINSDQGINSQEHQGVTPANLELTHNTIIGGDPCLRLGGWGNKTGLVFANNAVYCPSGKYIISDLTNAVISGNVIYPANTPLPSSGYKVGKPMADDLVDWGNKNVYPTSTSSLIGAGVSQYAPVDDFNKSIRTGAPDAGAYMWMQNSNPGWTVNENFKTFSGIAPSPPTDVEAY